MSNQSNEQSLYEGIAVAALIFVICVAIALAAVGVVFLLSHHVTVPL